jgi:transcriptional regulator MraZ
VVKSGRKWLNMGIKLLFLHFTIVMTTFIGDYTCKVDAKGRVVLPSAFKKQLDPAAKERFVVKKDVFEKCLVLYPMDEWERQIEIIRSKLNPYNKEHNRFLRGFYKGTAELLLDSNNRILIPKRLLDLVNINKDVVLAGQDGKIEVWEKSFYEALVEGEDEFAALAEKIMVDSSNDEK